MKALILITFLCCFHNLAIQAQDNEKSESRHSVSLTIGHEHVFNGRDENNKKKTLILPFWGIDYNFELSPLWKIGLHTDFVVESFKVEKNLEGGEEDVVERSRPIAPAMMVFYKPSGHWSCGLGLGGEFAKEEDYFLVRFAVEYGAEIKKGWEVFGGLQYDLRWNAYDTWTVGIGVAKAFGGKSKAVKE